MSMTVEGHDRMHEAWCKWLLSLDPRQWLAVKADELFYYDAYRSGNMSPPEILSHAMTHQHVERYSFSV